MQQAVVALVAEVAAINGLAASPAARRVAPLPKTQPSSDASYRLKVTPDCCGRYQAVFTEMSAYKCTRKSAAKQAYLDHEVFDAAVELCAGVVPLVRQHEEVFGGPRRQVRVQLDVQVACGDIRRKFSDPALMRMQDAGP